MNNSSLHMNVSSNQIYWLRRIIFIACIFFLCLAIVFGIGYFKNVQYRDKCEEQIKSRIVSACTNALDEASHLGSTISSDSNKRIAKTRQYVYSMEQFNALSVTMSGESGRVFTEEEFAAVYAVIDALDNVIQAAKNSTLDARTQLVEHLTIMKNYLNGL